MAAAGEKASGKSRTRLPHAIHTHAPIKAQSGDHYTHTHFWVEVRLS